MQHFQRDTDKLEKVGVFEFTTDKTILAEGVLEEVIADILRTKSVNPDDDRFELFVRYWEGGDLEKDLWGAGNQFKVYMFRVKRVSLDEGTG